MIGGGQIITFYSYKGGTGRSMHLANVAWILASNGKRVLMIDWDLEAPGLHRYFRPFLIDKELVATDGLIDLMWDFSDAAMTPVPDAERKQGWHETYTDLTRCTAAVRWTFPPPGRLDLLAAGRQGASYSRRVTAFNWQNFYDRLGGGVFLESLKARVRQAYDYVLIDSRTGVTDTAGICTVQLPEALVVCFTPNNQSIEGCAAIAQSVRAQWTQDGQRADHRRILPLLTRIDGSEKDKLDARRDLVRARFAEFVPSAAAKTPDTYWRDTEVPYVPWYSYEEVLAVFADRYREKISVLDSAEALTRLLTDGEITAAVRPSDEEREAVMAPVRKGTSEESMVPPVRKPDLSLASPYPGLQPFSRANANVFFGRKREIEMLAARLRAGERELYVVGPSGSGKSSLVHAGLVPVLQDSPERDLPRFLIRSLVPGAAPVARLAHALEIDARVEPHDWSAAVTDLLARHPECERILVILDQLEELFTIASAENRAAMIDAIEALRQQPRVALLLIVRADFFPQLLDSALWADGRPPTLLHVPPLSDDALREAIVGPAQAAGARVEPALVERLLADAADEPGALPLLQDTLAYLWSRSDGGVLTAARYAELGGTAGGLAAALALRADAAYASLDKPGQDAARRILLRLVGFGEGRPDTRRRQRRDDLAAGQDGPAFDDALRALIEQRLLTTYVTDDIVQVDLASERVISAWPRLQDWIRETRADEQRRRELEAAAARWIASGRNRAYLLGPGAARDAARWLRRNGITDLGISDEIRALVAASERAQRSRTARYAIVFGLLVVSISSGVAGGILLRKQKAEAEQALRERSTQVAQVYLAQGRALLAADQGARAAPYLLAARELGVDDLAARTSFRWASWQIPELSLSHRDPVTVMAWSPDGAQLVTAIRDGAVEVWDAGTGKRLVLPGRYAAAVLAMAWSADGRQFATASADGTAAVWTRAGKLVAPPFHHEAAVLAVDWSADGARLATASLDGTARIWDVATGKQLTPPLAHTTEVTTVAWSFNGAELATVSLDGTVRIWDASTGAPVQTFHAGGAVLDLAWTSDSTRLTTVERDHGVKIWNPHTGKLMQQLLENAGPVHAAARSPGGAKLAVAGPDGAVAIIEQGGTISQRFRSPVVVEKMSWSQRGSRLATAGDDRIVHIWDLETGGEASVAFALSAAVTSMQLNPDGNRVAAGGGDGIVQLWRVQSSLVALARVMREAPVVSIAWSADGKALTTLDTGGVVHRWGTAAGASLKGWRPSSKASARAWSHDLSRIALQVDGRADQVLLFDFLGGSSCSVRALPPDGSLAISPDGTKLVTHSNEERRLTLWDARSCSIVGKPSEPVPAGIANLVWDPSGRRIAFTTTDNRVWIWEVRTNHLASFTLKASVFALAWSPDGSRIATASADRIARVWDASTRIAVAATPAHPGQLGALAWSPDGSQIATTSADRTARVWSAVTGTPGAPTLIHASPVTALAWSPDGGRLATAADDRGLRIWDARLGQPVGPPIFHSGGITALAWSPDGTRLATGTDDSTALIWNLDGDPGLLADWRHVVDAGPFTLSSSGMLLPRDAPPPDEAQ